MSYFLRLHRPLRRLNSLQKLRLNILNIPILQHLLQYRLGVMFLERLSAFIPLEEMETCRVIGFAREAVVYDSGLEGGETCCFCVDCFEGVGVFGVGV